MPSRKTKYNPTPDEIREMCQKFKQGWSLKDEAQRRGLSIKQAKAPVQPQRVEVLMDYWENVEKAWC